MTSPNGRTSPRGPPWSPAPGHDAGAHPMAPATRSQADASSPRAATADGRRRAPRARTGVRGPDRSPTWVGSIHCQSDWASRRWGAHSHHSPMAYVPRRYRQRTASVCCTPRAGIPATGPGLALGCHHLWRCATARAANVESAVSSGPCVVSMAMTSPARLWRRRCLNETSVGHIQRHPEYRKH